MKNYYLFKIENTKKVFIKCILIHIELLIIIYLLVCFFVCVVQEVASVWLGHTRALG